LDETKKFKIKNIRSFGNCYVKIIHPLFDTNKIAIKNDYLDTEYKNKKKFAHNTWCHPGSVFALKTKLIDKCFIWDKGILGGGDILLWFGLIHKKIKNLKVYQKHINEILINNAIKKDYEIWLNCMTKQINDKDKEVKAGYIKGVIYHLYHGSTINRQYGKREKIMKKNVFDPSKDIILDQNIYKWTNNNHLLQKNVYDYFVNRKEDKI